MPIQHRLHWSGLIDALLLGFLYDAPIDEASQNAPRCSGDRLALSELLTDPSLDMGCGTRSLQTHETTDDLCDRAKKRIHRHGHAPVDSHVLTAREPLHQLQPVIPKGLEVWWHRYPDPEQNGDGLLAIATLRCAAYGQLVAQACLEGGVDLRSGLFCQHQRYGVLEPIELNPLTETYLHRCVHG
jgi:hypothetical protein